MSDVGPIGAALIWGLGTALVYGLSLWNRYWNWRRFRDSRSYRHLVTNLGLFIAALCAAASVTAVTLNLGDVAGRRFLGGLAYASFTAAGLLMWQKSRNEADA